MSATKNPKESIPYYEMLSEWDEVLLGDEELFREMTETHMPALLISARNAIRHECFLRNLTPDTIQPEELVDETLIQAWKARQGRGDRESLKRWLLRVQERTLQNMITEEKNHYAPIAVSLESPVPSRSEYIQDDENELWRSFEAPVRERWEDVIPDKNTPSIAA